MTRSVILAALLLLCLGPAEAFAARIALALELPEEYAGGSALASPNAEVRQWIRRQLETQGHEVIELQPSPENARKIRSRAFVGGWMDDRFAKSSLRWIRTLVRAEQADYLLLGSTFSSGVGMSNASYRGFGLLTIRGALGFPDRHSVFGNLTLVLLKTSDWSVSAFSFDLGCSVGLTEQFLPKDLGESLRMAKAITEATALHHLERTLQLAGLSDTTPPVEACGTSTGARQIHDRYQQTLKAAECAPGPPFFGLSAPSASCRPGG